MSSVGGGGQEEGVSLDTYTGEQHFSPAVCCQMAGFAAARQSGENRYPFINNYNYTRLQQDYMLLPYIF